MSGSDIWTAVVPAWLGGVGGMAAAVVSTVALIKSLRTEGGIKTLRNAANATDTTASLIVQADAEGYPGGTHLLPEASGAAPARSPVDWTAWQESKNRFRLRNDSIHTGATARLTSFQDVTPGGGEAAAYLGALPVELAANESVPFIIEKSLVSPSVTAIRLNWEDGDGTLRQRTIYI